MSSRTLSLLLYNALLPLGLLFMAPAALVKMRRRGGRWQDFAQRLGFFGREKGALLKALDHQSAGHRVWIHAVSVGEVGVARRLIAAWLKSPSAPSIILTTTTPTGYKLACEMEQAFAGRVVVLYSPLDLPWVARRMVRELKPTMLVLVEAEIWPNIVSTASDAGLPIALVNARLSARSEARYLKALSLIKPIFSMLDLVLVQEPEDVSRWSALGVKLACIHYVGSLKYDPQGAAANPEQIDQLREVLIQSGIDPQRPIVLAASTHPGEELELGRVYKSILQQLPDAALLLVPRHFERGADVMREQASLGLVPVQRSSIVGQDKDSPPPERRDVLVVDSTGELCAWQSLATVVVVGKSFLAEGGQNPAEAVMANKPVVFGPHMENFEPLVSLLLGCGGACQVKDFAELEELLPELLLNAARREQISLPGRAALAKHYGAIDNSLVKLCEVLEIKR